MGSQQYIQVEKKENIAIVRINRPEKLNAMNIDVIKEMGNIMDQLDKDDGVKVVIVTGTGEKAFSAGADIEYMSKISPLDAEQYAMTGHTTLNKIENLSKPVIAAVNGYALGGGCELSLACDLRIASKNAAMGQPEVTIGICPGWGGTQRLMRVVGIARAKDLIYTGRRISADEAFQMGLVNKVVELPQLMDECMNIAKQIAKNSAIAVRVSKTLLNRGIDSDINTGLKLEIFGWSLCFTHPDREQRMTAFVQKK
ncbi:MAG: 3-hydroxypropionyl-coenzyme A dehydratase [Candidatus Nitrosomirales archaeon]|jgi:3-hydroxypropionyl-coenzyme A dehydratase